LRRLTQRQQIRGKERRQAGVCNQAQAGANGPLVGHGHTISLRVLVGHAVRTASAPITHPTLIGLGRAVLTEAIYSLDRIAQSRGPPHDLAMPLSTVPQAPKRPADNELYDRGCDLVEAAMAIRRLADDPGAGRAVPALLGCIEAALHELGCAVSSIDEAGRHEMPTEAMADRMHRGFMNLGLALADAELASTAARGLAGRSLVVTAGSPSPRATRRRLPSEVADIDDSTHGRGSR
jgi:hypothetical protein